MTKEEIVSNGNKAFIREVSDGGKANIFVVGYMACAYEYEKRIAELEAQIEKMKNCKNCKKLEKDKDGWLVCSVGSFYTNTFGKNCKKWEIKEK